MIDICSDSAISDVYMNSSEDVIDGMDVVDGGVL